MKAHLPSEHEHRIRPGVFSRPSWSRTQTGRTPPPHYRLGHLNRRTPHARKRTYSAQVTVAADDPRTDMACGIASRDCAARKLAEALATREHIQQSSRTRTESEGPRGSRCAWWCKDCPHALECIGMARVLKMLVSRRDRRRGHLHSRRGAWTVSGGAGGSTSWGANFRSQGGVRDVLHSGSGVQALRCAPQQNSRRHQYRRRVGSATAGRACKAVEHWAT